MRQPGIGRLSAEKPTKKALFIVVLGFFLVSSSGRGLGASVKENPAPLMIKLLVKRGKMVLKQVLSRETGILGNKELKA